MTLFQIINGDCRDELELMPDNSIDAIVTDPPYELNFMGKGWDNSGVAYDPRVWRQCLRVLKPGGHLLSFGGSRTYHRMACAIEDAGFEIRDQIMWVYGTGFPKSLDISKAIDKAAGAEREVIGQKLHARKGVASAEERTTIGAGAFGEARMGDVTAPATAEAKEWDGWGTALKPAHEPIVLARKPLDGTVANNVLTHGVGGINIDGCRVASDEKITNHSRSSESAKSKGKYGDSSSQETHQTNGQTLGRFPANFIHDGLDEVLELFPSDKPNQSVARFFYCAKASKKDRNEGLDDFEEKSNKFGNQKNGEDLGNGSVNDKFTTQPQKNNHPTVKPTDLMRYLCRLITPPNGTVLDPFTGSGSTGKAAVLEGFSFIGIEQSEEYVAIAKARIEAVL
jgi:site-specific DNA-methyltransferase (adenine-specific)